MGKIEKLGLVLWAFSTISLAVNVICNTFSGTDFDISTNTSFFFIGLILYVAGKPSNIG
jgi:hypothetical protein